MKKGKSIYTQKQGERNSLPRLKEIVRVKYLKNDLEIDKIKTRNHEH